MKNKILDYNQVINRLYKMEKYSNKIISRPNIGTTTFDLPILHYTAGTGKNHVVLAAAQHGCEIITTDFILRVMESISREDPKFDFLKNKDITLHFLPMLNPEGYLISTSVIRKVINKEMPDDEAQEVYEDYLEAYKKDNYEAIKLKLKTAEKYHQMYFGHISPYVILLNKFRKIGKNLERMHENSNIPEGALITWHSNGNGVDLNQNTPYNYKIDLIKEGKKSYSFYRYNNIETTSPGPIGCPTQGIDFKYEPENEALFNFLLSLKNNKDINLCAFFNYHSTGGVIYYRPYEYSGEIKEDTMKFLDMERIYNKKIAEYYGKFVGYKVIHDQTTLTCFNELIRMIVPRRYIDRII